MQLRVKTREKQVLCSCQTRPDAAWGDSNLRPHARHSKPPQIHWIWLARFPREGRMLPDSRATQLGEQTPPWAPPPRPLLQLSKLRLWPSGPEQTSGFQNSGPQAHGLGVEVSVATTNPLASTTDPLVAFTSNMTKTEFPLIYKLWDSWEEIKGKFDTGANISILSSQDCLHNWAMQEISHSP